MVGDLTISVARHAGASPVHYGHRCARRGALAARLGLGGGAE